MEGPEAVMETWETVKSVRFWRRLSQTPVSFLRLLTAVNDRRFAASSAGKRIGEMGQSRNSKSFKVDNDLRAVSDNATSSEQLAILRETRWRKGVAPSQTVVELWRGEQGSLEVGTLKDCRALSCFGSRVEEEIAAGEGDDFGEGAVGAEECGGLGAAEGGLAGAMEVKVEKDGKKIIVKVACKKVGHQDLVVRIVEALEEMDLSIVELRVSCKYIFAMEAIVEAAEDEGLSVGVITLAILKTIDLN
nr:uncharacterized protein LOC109162466 [Ipomoea batatas]